MENHKDAISKLKFSVKSLAQQGRDTRAQVRALKYGEDGARRPETGFERHQLRNEYLWRGRRKARVTLLAYGLLRGVPYKVMEAKCEEPPSVSAITEVIQEALGDAEELKAVWTYDYVKKLVEGPSEAEEAA